MKTLTQNGLAIKNVASFAREYIDRIFSDVESARDTLCDVYENGPIQEDDGLDVYDRIEADLKKVVKAMNTIVMIANQDEAK